MLAKSMFEQGENKAQDYFFFKNEVTKEMLHAIRNKQEKNWFGMYDNNKEERFFVIPVQPSPDSDVILTSICDWYNNGKPEREYKEAPASNPSHILETLMGLKNMMGEFPLSSAKRIQSYLDEPIVERWNDISGIIVDGKKTVWQLICEQDASYIHIGRTTDVTGKIVKDWSKIPSPLEVLRAVKRGVKESE